MRQYVLTLLSLGLMTAAVAADSPSARTQQSYPKTQTLHRKKNAGRVPFHGKLASVDPWTGAICLLGKEKVRVLQVTPRTRLTRSGFKTTLGEASVGETVAGLVVKRADGKEEAVSVRFGPKPKALNLRAAPPAQRPCRPSGS
jgi:hypothetical protein